MPTTSRMRHPDRRGAFTIIELLIVIAIIGLLLGILIVALSAASSRAQTARTSTLMTSIKSALVTFEGDHGYFPPVLAPDRSVFAPPNPADFAALQDWASLTSLAEYLLGYGPAAADGYGPPNESWMGLRSPGPDGIWGASLTGVRNPPTTGKVYGPYLELKDENLLGSVDISESELPVYLPREAGFDENDPRVIVDFWGNPILYYRPHPAPARSLADVVVLRPYQIRGNSVVDGAPDAAGDTATTFAQRAGQFGLLSLGPDRVANKFIRFDDPDSPGQDVNNPTVFSNEDNIREVGP